MKKGKIQIYTGDGKGKTTAALGVALRTIGAGKRAALIQFLKKPKYSEHKAIKKYKLPIDVEAFGIGYYKILGDKHTEAQHKAAARKALLRAEELIKKDKHAVIILDEINVAIGFGLVNVNEVVSIISNQGQAEIILTGRRAHPKLKKLADLISEMKPIKHYFDKGLKARKGIEF